MGSFGRLRRADLAALAFLVALGLWVLAPNLGHPMIVSWDEGAHQAVTRGLHDTWLPVIYRDPLVPIANDDWFSAGVFLHKPTLPFFLGALLMHVTGVTPLALRLVSLCGEIGAALVIFLLARRELGRWLALLLAGGFLLLPFGWQLVQGVQFGDVTDCSLVGFVCVAFLFLVRAVERESTLDAAVAGAACGAAILCKSALAITPIGALGVLWLVHASGWMRGVQGRQLLWFGAAATLVAGPYNLYCERRWPTLFWHAAAVTWSHLNTGVGAWEKPLDALFNEIGTHELGAVCMAFFLLAGLWVLRVAWRTHSPTAMITALWLWGEWVPLSYAKAKVPATMWGAVPAMLLAAGYLLRDARRSPPLGLAALAAVLSPWILKVWPAVSLVRRLVPTWLPETRAMAGLAEGLALASLAALLGVAAKRAFGARWSVPGALACLASAALLVGVNGESLSKTIAHEQERFPESYTELLGRALDAHLPDRSILFLDLGRDPPCCAEKQNLMFWSGRMVYPPTAELVRLAQQRGDHPYLVSSLAEPFERVADVPAGAWLQAFDLERPLEGPAALPPDLHAPAVAGSDILGVGIAPDVAGQGRYALYLRPSAGTPRTLFKTDRGDVAASPAPAAGLVSPARAASSPWVELPLLGPPSGEVAALEVGGVRVNLR